MREVQGDVELTHDSMLDHPVDEPELTVHSAWCAFSEVRNMSTELRWRDRTLKLALLL